MLLKVLRRASENVFVPLTVGGGIRDFTDLNGRSDFSVIWQVNHMV
jgi:imidazole glycerol phosphate synthase subunit HisF